MGRANGYYWVQSEEGWIIAYWRNDNWWAVGIEEPITKFVGPVDERRLVRPDEVK